MFDIIKGYLDDSCCREDMKLKTKGAMIEPGAWVEMDAVTGEVSLPTAAGKFCFPVISGTTNRRDTQTLGVVTVAQGMSFVAETSVIEPVTFTPGMKVSVSANGKLKAAAGADVVVGVVIRPQIDGKVTFTRVCAY